MSEYATQEEYAKASIIVTRANNCLHMMAKPMCKEQGGACMKCERYFCVRCLDTSYKAHTIHPIGHRKLYHLLSKQRYQYISCELVDEFKQKDMFHLCYECVETINHPSWKEIALYWLHKLCCCFDG